MSTTPHAPDPHDDTENKGMLTPEQEEKIRQKIAGEKIEELDPEQIKKIVGLLKDPNASFLDAYKGIGRIMRKDLARMKPEDKEKLENQIQKLVVDAIDKNEEKIEAKIKELNGKKAAAADLEKEKIQKTIDALASLLDLLESSPAHISKILYPEPEEKKEEAAETAPERTPDDHSIPTIKEIESPEDIKRGEAVCRKIITKYGTAPAEKHTKDLYWKNEKDEKKKTPLSSEEIAKFLEFNKFLKIRDAILKQIQKDAAERGKKLNQELEESKNHEKMRERLHEEVEELLDDLLEKSKSFGELAGGYDEIPEEKEPKYPEHATEAILLDTLGVDDLQDAYGKLQNVIQLQMVPSVRKGKNIFELATDKDGKPKQEKLEDFLARPEHMGYSEKMVEQTHEALLKLYKTAGKDLGLNMEELRDVLIQAIKTRGSAKIKIKSKVISEEEAKKLYTAFLVVKAPHLGEKEALALLIAFREKPPFVYDLENTGKGWKVIGSKKEGPGVLEDFCLDAMIYTELMEKLGMSRIDFNNFIQKIAPQFEEFRSVIEKGKNPKELTSDELEKFKQLMKIPLWIDKIGQAFKYSLYDSKDRHVPVVIKKQGPDTQKLNIMFVNIEEKLQRIAIRLADERLDQELKEAGPQGWGQFWRIDKIACKWWKRNAAVAYREKYIAEIMKRLKEDPKYRTELMGLNREEVKPGGKWSGKVPAEGRRENINADLDAIAERFGISLTGDRDSYLTGNETIEDATNQAIQNAIKSLCQNYINDAIDDSQFRAGMKPIITQIQAYKGTNDEIIGFLEETRNRGDVDINKQGLLDKLRAHKAGLIALDLDNMRIHLGTAKNVDVKTQAKDLNWSDQMSRRLMERLQRGKFLGRFVTPATVGIMGFGLANITAQIITGRTLRWGSLALAPFMGPAMWGIAAGCLAGGVFAALRKNKETLYHKAQKERRDALDYRPDIDRKGLRPNQPEPDRFERRMESSDSLYNKVSAEQLRNDIETARAAGDFDLLRDALGRAISRNKISENERIDLIKFEGEESQTNMETQRLAFLRAIAEGKAALKAMTAPGRPSAGRDWIMELNMSEASAENAIRTNMGAAEEQFKKFKRGENLKAAGIGAAFGAGAAAALTGIAHLAGLNQQTTVTGHRTEHLTPNGPVDKAAMLTKLKGAGLSDSEIRSLAFDARGNPSAQTLALLQSKNVTLESIAQPPTISTHTNVIHLFGGARMNNAQLMLELKAKGINLTSANFDSSGRLVLSPAEVLKLRNLGLTVREIPVGTRDIIAGGLRIDQARFIQEMGNRGVRLTPSDFDATGKLTPGALAQLRANHINIHEFTAPPQLVAGGSTLSQTRFIQEMGTRGVRLTPSDFDATGKLTPGALAQLQAHRINVQHLSTGSQLIANGATMDQARFIQEMGGRGIRLTLSDFDAQGNLTPQALANLNSHNISVVQNLIGGGGTKAQALNAAGFHQIGRIHYNGHTPKHILDELRLKWHGKPDIAPDGNCHFTMKEMLDPRLTHTKLPSGVSMPSDPTKFKIGLRMRVDGKDVWRFFSPDSTGEVKIPQEYFSQNVGYVPRGTGLLPGLRTSGMAVGFEDHRGTYQIMASVYGKGSYAPPQQMVNFTGTQNGVTQFTADIGGKTEFTGEGVRKAFQFTADHTVKETVSIPKPNLYNLSQGVTEVQEDFMVTPPIVASPMSHLEYGKKKPPPPPDDDSDDSDGSDGEDDIDDSDDSDGSGGDTPEPPPEPPPPPDDTDDSDDSDGSDGEDDIDDSDDSDGGGGDTPEPPPPPPIVTPEPDKDPEPIPLSPVTPDVTPRPEIIEVPAKRNVRENAENWENGEKYLAGFHKFYHLLNLDNRLQDENFSKLFPDEEGGQFVTNMMNFQIDKMRELAKSRDVNWDEFAKKFAENLENLRKTIEYYETNLQNNDPLAKNIEAALKEMPDFDVLKAFSVVNWLLRKITGGLPDTQPGEEGTDTNAWNVAVEAPKQGYEVVGLPELPEEESPEDSDGSNNESESDSNSESGDSTGMDKPEQEKEDTPTSRILKKHKINFTEEKKALIERYIEDTTIKMDKVDRWRKLNEALSFLKKNKKKISEENIAKFLQLTTTFFSNTEKYKNEEEAHADIKKIMEIGIALLS